MSDNNGTNGHGVTLDFSATTTSDIPNVDAVKLLNQVTDFISKYVKLSTAQAYIVAAWVAHTHAIAAATETPYLAIHSPEKMSGKTRLLEVLELLVNKPWFTGRVTAACLVRKIDSVRPTLLLDESDAAFHGDKEYAEALRGILNTGHREDGKASCCVGQGTNITFKDFKTFCPKAIAGIGRNLPDTVADRSCPIHLKRKAPGEQVHRFRRREVKPAADELKMALSTWLAPIVPTLRESRPMLPEQLTDRRQDGLEPLLAIAEAAGGEWPQRIRSAAIEIFGGSAGDDQSVGVLLLSDIQKIFDTTKADKMPSVELVAKLAEIETSPWAEWSHGKPITVVRLSRLLEHFEIAPRTIRVEGSTPKGYLRESFKDAWSRYIPSVALSPTFDPQHPPQGNVHAGPEHFSNAPQGPRVSDQKSEKSSMFTRVVAGVADQTTDRERKRDQSRIEVEI